MMEHSPSDYVNDIEMIIHDYNDKTLGIQELHNLLSALRQLITNNWDYIKNIYARDSVRNSKLGSLMYPTDIHLKVGIASDSNTLINNDKAIPLLSGFFISDATLIRDKNKVTALAINTPDPSLATSFIFTLLSYSGKNYVKDYISGS